ESKGLAAEARTGHSASLPSMRVPDVAPRPFDSAQGRRRLASRRGRPRSGHTPSTALAVKDSFGMAYYLGVDGGASKTAALVTDDSGRQLGDGIAGPSNHLRVGIETAARNIERAVNKALVTADVASREI